MFSVLAQAPSFQGSSSANNSDAATPADAEHILGRCPRLFHAAPSELPNSGGNERFGRFRNRCRSCLRRNPRPSCMSPRVRSACLEPRSGAIAQAWANGPGSRPRRPQALKRRNSIYFAPSELDVVWTPAVLGRCPRLIRCRSFGASEQRRKKAVRKPQKPAPVLDCLHCPALPALPPGRTTQTSHPTTAPIIPPLVKGRR